MSVDNVTAQLNITYSFEMVLPKEAGFQEIDLAKNEDEALQKAETAATTK